MYLHQCDIRKRYGQNHSLMLPRASTAVHSSLASSFGTTDPLGLGQPILREHCLGNSSLVQALRFEKGSINHLPTETYSLSDPELASLSKFAHPLEAEWHCKNIQVGSGACLKLNPSSPGLLYSLCGSVSPCVIEIIFSAKLIGLLGR